MADDSKAGLYRKFSVSKIGDLSGKHEHCRYFVLDLDHDEFAVPPLLIYANLCEKKYPVLAKDLRILAKQYGYDPVSKELCPEES